MVDKTTSNDWASVQAVDGDPSNPPQSSATLLAIRIVLAIAASFLLWSFLELRRNDTFEASAISTQGAVADKWVSRSYRFYRRSGSRSYKKHYIAVAFTDQAGKEQRVRERVGATLWKKLSFGSPVLVWYVPGDPANYAILTRERFRDEYGLLAVSVICLAIAGWLYFESLATRSRNRPLYANIKDRIRQRKERRAEKLRRAPSIYRPMT